MAEDAGNVDSPGSDWVPTGRRRSTYSPPPAGVQYEPAPESALGGQSAAPPAFSPQLHEGDLLDSDETEEGDTEAIGFSPPPRRSLDDTELAEQIGRADTGTIDQISLLQQELQLREADARDFESWERAMLELGTPEALHAVEQARPAFTGVVPIIPPPPQNGAATTASPPDPAPAAEQRADTGPGIDLPLAEDATVDAVLLDDREAVAEPDVRFAEDFVVIDQEEKTPSAWPPPLVLPPEPRAESDLDRVLRARWLALDAPEEPPGSRVSTDTGGGPVSTPGGNLLLADVHGLSDMRLQSVDTGGIAKLPPPGQFPPSGAVPVVTGPVGRRELPADERVAHRPRLFSLERGGVEPTPIEQRNGRAARLFWLWFGANGTALSVAIGAVLMASGMSLRQGIVAALVGIGLSFLPLGLGTLAGKRSGLPTMIVSRATFGLLGNVIPAVLAVVTRVFWGAVFLWLLATTVVGILSDVLAEPDRPLAFLLTLGVGLLAAAANAVFGFRLLERVQLVLSIVSAVVLAAFVALTAGSVDLGGALTVQDGPWVRVVGGAVLVFSVVGLLWAQSTSDLARYQRVQSSSARSMLWSSFGAGLPTFLLIVWGCLLAASSPTVADGLVEAPFATLASLLPDWFPVPLLLATALPLLSALTVTLYSGGLALQSSGVRIARDVGVVGTAILVLALALLLTYTVDDMRTLLLDVATTIAVPVAAWTGIFCAEMMIRHRQFDARSLLQRGGRYVDFRWVNLGALILATAIGFGLTSASLSFLDWQGYLLPLLGMQPDGALGQTDPGVLVALGLGLLTPLLLGVNAVRGQEGGR
ncbi:purine-cytosine permease family protein [Lysobacter korlensis]|uniref:Purine-cytosine permease family protein n=1 Tax=Lysobacter korlensis TaxID=553636 RepID=A0ABV6RQD9_9GAMM